MARLINMMDFGFGFWGLNLQKHENVIPKQKSIGKNKLAFDF